MRTFINSQEVWPEEWMAIICQKSTRNNSSILWIHRPFWSQAFLQHLNTSDLHEGDCSANSFHQSSLGEQWCLPGLPAKTTCSHVLIIAYYVCFWMVFVCLISMTCCLWSMIGQGGAKASAGSTPSTQLGSFRIAASCWHVIWEMCSAGGQSCMGRDWINGRLSSLNSLKI